jgi:hypothetical protein
VEVHRVIDVVVVVVLLAVFTVAVVARRRQKDAKRGRAATVELVIDEHEVRRRLADGREESARWADVVSVEVVCTPVRTADGAKAFVLIAEGPEAGCLVPLGVGHDDALVQQLVRLRQLRIQDFTAAQEHRPPRRTMVWTRETPTD